jgi:hypothetical protein
MHCHGNLPAKKYTQDLELPSMNATLTLQQNVVAFVSLQNSFPDIILQMNGHTSP